MKETNEGFVFYQSYANAVKTLPPKEQPKLLWAIVNKGLYDEEPELEGVAAGMYSLIAPNIEANRNRYQRSMSSAENGKRGGRPKKNKTDDTDEESDDDDDADFEAFWEEYPRKINKDAAIEAWYRINPTAEESEHILEKLKAVKQSDPRFAEERYTPFPAKWLDNKEWEYEYKSDHKGSFDTDEYFTAAINAFYGMEDVS